jgi:hypothetical protein
MSFSQLLIPAVAVGALLGAVGFGGDVHASPTPSSIGQVTIGQAGGNLPIVVQPGDTVNLIAQLNSSDPNENAEFEPLNINAVPGGSFNQSYSLPSYNINTPLTIPITNANTTISAFFTGADGDETASIQYRVNAPLVFTIQEKQIAAGLSQQYTNVADFVSQGGGACTGAVSATLGCQLAAAVGKVATGLSAYQNLIAGDPPDPNYHTIFQPQPLPSQALSPQAGLSSGQLAIVNALISNMQDATSLSQAIYVTLNRAQTASDAGDQAALQQQLNALAGYQSQLNALLGAQPGLLTQVAQILEANGLDITLTASDVANFQAFLLQNGFPSDWATYLEDIGLSTADLQLALDQLIVQALPSGSLDLASILTAPSLIGALEGSTGATAVPEPTSILVMGIGLVVLFLLRQRGKMKPLHSTRSCEIAAA